MTAEDPSNTAYTYDAANELTAMNADGTATNFTYDDWGRMAGKTQGSYAATYGYRFGDKLKSVTSNFPGENASVGYNYDGLGKRRFEQLDNTTATWFRWSGWEESGEYAGTPNTWTVGAKQTGYVPGLAAYAGADPATADWRFNLNDHLGSPRQMLGQDKSAKARYDFSPYGELMRSAGLPLTVGYTGHRWDPAIGQYFAPFRYYNPQTARWNMRDPLGMVDGLNTYAYVAGSPIRYFDTEGGSIVAWDTGGLFDYLADLGDCLAGHGKGNGTGAGNAPHRNFPPGWSMPWFTPFPKLPKVLGKMYPHLRPYSYSFGGSPWTTPAEVLRVSPIGKLAIPASRALLRAASKWSPWITIVDGALSYARIASCAITGKDDF
jgi:RHS repeat-associated protein